MESAAAFGLVLEPADISQAVLVNEFFLWPENLVSFNLWLAVQTQWRTDKGRRTGLDYAGVRAGIQMRHAGKAASREFELYLFGMEQAALEEFSKFK